MPNFYSLVGTLSLNLLTLVEDLDLRIIVKTKMTAQLIMQMKEGEQTIITIKNVFIYTAELNLNE